MKSLLILLLVTGSAISSRAQGSRFGARDNSPSKADLTFNMAEGNIRHRHKASLDQGNSMTVELEQQNQYDSLKDLEALLAEVSSDIAFVRDTVKTCPQCNYRVDYVININGMKNYRIRKYEPQGTFLYQKGMSIPKAFKPESDTLRILIRRQDTLPLPYRFPYARATQITFLLNRLSNLDSLLAQTGRINAIIDTFQEKSAPRYKSEKKYPFLHESSIFISRDWFDTTRMRVSHYPSLNYGPRQQANTFGGQAHIGAGFLRANIVPAADLGLVYRLPFSRALENKTFLGVYIAGYFGFAKDGAGNYRVEDNWFLNAEVGEEEAETEFTPYIKVSRFSIGFGYLISGKGDYFKGTTMKAFVNLRLLNGITVSPEIIATDNFRQVFPGITVKVL